MILLDTQAAIWVTTNTSQLSTAAAEALREASGRGDGLALASTSLWELAMVMSRGRLSFPGGPAVYLQYVESLFVILPITGAIAARSVEFSSRYPKDPSDRIIGATALVHGMKLVTSDKFIRKSGEVPTIW